MIARALMVILFALSLVASRADARMPYDGGWNATVVTRGIIKIVDLQKLKELSCECYETLREEAPL
jgi:hypothetical protein